jgi:hypothetical protein
MRSPVWHTPPAPEPLLPTPSLRSPLPTSWKDSVSPSFTSLPSLPRENVGPTRGWYWSWPRLCIKY